MKHSKRTRTVTRRSGQWQHLSAGQIMEAVQAEREAEERERRLDQ